MKKATIRLSFLPFLILIPAFPKQDAGSRLTNILNKAALYCQRLENAALDFVCLEEISEEVNYSRDRFAISRNRDNLFVENSYVYDFQFIRKDNIRKETRTLILKNGRPGTVKDSGLLTSAIRVEYILFGPIGLLGENWRPRRIFRIAGEGRVLGECAIIVESWIRPGLEGRHCDGKAWIREKDGSVLKIDWDQSTLGGFRHIEKLARSFKSKPQMTSMTEHGFEKNGLRFPSLDITEEAYLKAGEQPFVRARTEIRYKGYRFFTVETKSEVLIK